MKGTFFDRVLGPKSGPEDFAGEPNCLCRVCDTGKPDGACREAESIQKSLPRRQQSGFNTTTKRVGKMFFFCPGCIGAHLASLNRNLGALPKMVDFLISR